MRRDKRFTVLSAIVLLTLLYSLLIPTGALADEATPPADTTSDTVEAESTPPPPAVVATEETEEPTQEPALEEALPTAEASSVETAPEETDGETVIEIVAAAAEQDVTLADSSGDPLELGSSEAFNLLTNGDPFFWNGSSWVGYTTTGTGCPAGVTCLADANPFQAAVNAAAAGTTIYVAGDDNDATPTAYAENVTINTANLSFIGFENGTAVLVGNTDPTLPTYDPGYANVTSITLNALFGSTTGVTATTVFVNPGGSVQDGVDLVKDGGAVRVAPGTYNESNILIDKGLTLTGWLGGSATIGDPLIPGADLGAPILEGSGGIGVIVSHDDVTIQGLYFTGYDKALFLDGSPASTDPGIYGSGGGSGGIQDLYVLNNTFVNNLQFDIYASGRAQNPEMHYNVFIDVDSNGFPVLPVGYALYKPNESGQYNMENNYWGCDTIASVVHCGPVGYIEGTLDDFSSITPMLLHNDDQDYESGDIPAGDPLFWRQGIVNGDPSPDSEPATIKVKLDPAADTYEQCDDPNADNNGAMAECTYTYCTDPNADNYGELGQCTYTYCTDPNADNYGELGQCTYTYCTDPNADNYGELGQCTYTYCTDPKADNYGELGQGT
jgi:hypothetical protein